MMLFQLQIINSTAGDTSKSEISAALLHMSTPVEEVASLSAFQDFIQLFFTQNRNHYEEYRRLYTALHKPMTDVLEITYYFTPSTQPKELLHYQVTLDDVATLFHQDHEYRNTLFSQIFEHICDIKRVIVCENGDSAANITKSAFISF